MTASFGAEQFHSSARRLITQAEGMNIFSDIVHVNESNISRYAPKVAKKYSQYLKPTVRGFGYYSWKPEIINSVMHEYSDYGVIYIDAGCELNSKLIARSRMKRIMKRTNNGGFFHVLHYPEINYSKKKVLDYFSLSEVERWSWQIQATWLLLSGEQGREISQKWVDSALVDISMLDDSSQDEHPEFKSNRYDQSLLSCLLKSLNIKPSRHRPCYRPLTTFSKVACAVHPIWSARNRTGVSIQPHLSERRLSK